MVMEAGVEPLLHARVVDCEATDGRVTQVRIATAGELVTMRPRVVIDASGRCIIPLQAGAPVIAEGANKHLPMSLYFTLWETPNPVRPVLPPGCPEWQSNDELPMTSLHYFPSGKVEVKMKIVGFDAADGFDLSCAEVHARRHMMALIYYLQTKGYPSEKQRLDRHVLASVSRHIGIREERRMVGEHVLTEDEATQACEFVDGVAVGTYHLDFHWPDKKERAGTGITTMVEPYQIPLRAMIPQGLRNVLVPGRGASGDQMAMSSFRVMATVAQMGFACGEAAALALATGCDVPDVDIATLRANLEARGQSLDLSVYGDYLRRLIHAHETVAAAGEGWTECHASTLVRTDMGHFLAAWFAGTKEGKDDVGIWLAERRRAAWGLARRVAKISDEPHWNPVLHRDADGTVQLWFKVGPKPHNWRTYVMVSSDGGATWGTPRELVPGDVGGRGPVKNKPLVLADGSLLAPNSIEIADGEWYALADRSDDGGRTWTASAPIRPEAGQVDGPGVIQPALWESAPGVVHMLLRSSGGRVCRADSADGGRTWTPAYPTDLPNNNSGLDVAQLADGTLALIFNPVGTNWGPRYPLTLALSTDNGLTWPRRLDLETADGEFSYPAIIPTTTGMAITYTDRRHSIRFWHGSVERIPLAGAAPPIIESHGHAGLD